MTTPLEAAYLQTNTFFDGSYANAQIPLWASAATGASIGPDIQVSTVTVAAAPNTGIILDAAGTIEDVNAAPIAFLRTADQAFSAPSLLQMTANQIQGGGATENISIVNNTGTFYDDLALGKLRVYGDTTVSNPIGEVAILEQYGTSTDSQLTTTGFHLSSLFVSTINGAPVGGNAGPDLLVSTITVNPTGVIRMDADGTIDAPTTAGLFFRYTPDLEPSVFPFPPGFKMSRNYIDNVLPPSTIENVSLTRFHGPPATGLNYDSMALGNLYLYGTNNYVQDTVGQIALFRQWEDSPATQDVELITTGFHTSSIFCSTINGQVPGGGGSYTPNLQLSTLEMYSSGTITLDISGSAIDGVQSAELVFKKTTEQPIDATRLAMQRNNIRGALAPEPTPIENLTVFEGNDYGTLTTGNLLLYGLTPLNNVLKGQIGEFRQWQTTQDVELVTTGFHASSIYTNALTTDTANISTLFVSSISDYIATVSSIVSDNVSSIAGEFATATVGTLSSFISNTVKEIVSSISFNASLGGVNLGGVDLGMGGYLGGLTGQLVTGATSMTIAGVALATGASALLTARTANNIYLPGQNSNGFSVVNGQTQLQFSTLGTQVSTFIRLTSSILGSDPTVDPAPEYIVFSNIPAGTTCLRSLSDPLNPINPSTFTSTLQSFGPWVSVPSIIAASFSTVTGDFVVQSTLTAYAANISTTINARGNITGGTLTSLGTISATQSITAGLNIIAGGNITTTGTIQGGIVQAGNIAGNNLTMNNNIVAFGNLSVTGSIATNSTITTPSSITSGANIGASSITTNGASVSSLTVSSINGFQYVPGGGIGVNPTFSTVTLGTGLQVPTGYVSTVLLNAVTANAGTVNVNTLSTNIITGAVATFGVSPNTTQITSGGIVAPNGQILTNTGQISSLQNIFLYNKTTSTLELLVSSVNGQLYPPAFNPVVTGPLTVSGLLTAGNITTAGYIDGASLTVTGNVAASGNVRGTVITANILESIGSLTAVNAAIGGVLIGPAGGLNATAMTTSNITISSINGSAYPPTQPQFSTTTGNFVIPPPYSLQVNTISTGTNIRALGTITGNAITGINANFSGVLTGVNANFIAGTTTVANGVLNLLNSVTFLSTTLMSGPLTAPFTITTNTLTAGQVSSINVSTSVLQAANILASTISCSDVAAIKAITTVSSINGVSYPPPGLGVSSYTQLFTSSLVGSTITVSGYLSTPGIYTSNVYANAGTVFTNGLAAISYITTGGTINASGAITSASVATTGDIASGNALIGSTLAVRGGIAAANASIGGVLIGPAGTINATQNITTNQAITAGATITGRDISSRGNITASTANISLLLIDLYGNLTTPNALQGSYIYSTDIILANNNIQCGKKMVCSTISSTSGIITQLAVSTINGYAYPQSNVIADTISVNTINQLNYPPSGPAVSTLNINGNINFSSLEGIQVQGAITGLNGLYITDGGGVIQGRTEILGTFVANNDVTLSTTSVFGDFTVVAPRIGTIDNFVSAKGNIQQINPDLNIIPSTTQIIGNSSNWGQDSFGSPPYPLAMRQSGTTYQTGYDVIGFLPKGGGTTLLPWGIDSRAPCVVQTYAWTGVDTFFGFWTSFAGNGPGGAQFSAYTTAIGPTSNLSLTATSTIPKPTNQRVRVSITNTSATTDAVNINVSWTIFPGVPPFPI